MTSSKVAPIPARAALEAAVATNARNGHGNHGALSERHGFLPQEPPLGHLPPSHTPWDETAACLPELFRSLGVRTVLADMPVLSAAAGHLDDRFLLRASTILSIFAHAFHHVDPDHPEPLPGSISGPWQQVSERLGQPGPHLSFNDMNTYNWRRRDPAGPIEVENLELLVPIVGNDDERRFQMTPVEITARFTPIVGAVVRAQEAVVSEDPVGLKEELRLIADTLHVLTFAAFPKVDPNPSSPHHVNPVVWGKTVAPLATPFQDDPPPGPSGTAIPAFQLLDAFFGRHRYDSTVGSETARARRWFPVHWRVFLDAVERVSVPDHVAGHDDDELRGLFQAALSAYRGDDGLLGRHRLKTFGYLDLSFKAGRSETLGGFAGSFESRPWDQMDGELAHAIEERAAGPSRYGHRARLVDVERLRDGDGTTVSEVTLSVAGSGLRYRSGSRCAVLPESSQDLVARTLRALRARGDEPITLDGAWRTAVSQREGFEEAHRLPLRLLLTFGRIRPVERRVAKTLFAMSRNEQLRSIIEARAEDQWELWDLLELLAGSGFRTSRLWKAQPGDWHHICGIVPPERPRLFSIASTMRDPDALGADRLTLTVAGLRYDTTDTEVSSAGTRHGTGSNFLARADPEGMQRDVTIDVVPAPRLTLPDDPRRPVIMIAGGTGISPFLGMIEERARTPNAGRTWLLLGTGTPEEIYGAPRLRSAVEDGALEARIAFSRADQRAVSAVVDGRPQLRIEPATRMRLDAWLRTPELADEVRSLLFPSQRDALGAVVLLCGRAGFAAAIEEALEDVVGHAGGDGGSSAPRAVSPLARLTGEGRYVPEVYTTYVASQREAGTYLDASEVVDHNDDGSGYWAIIEGRVYDLTRFADLHPGGDKIIRSYAGLDATAAYRTAQHHVHPEVDALRSLYEIASVRRLDLGAGWGVAVGPAGLTLVTAKDVYRAWIGALYATVEMENALNNDLGVRHEPVTHDERTGAVRPSPFRSRTLFQTHQRFVGEYLPGLTGERVEHLWAISSGLSDPHADVRWMRRAIGALHDGEDARAAAGLEGRLDAVFARAAGRRSEARPEEISWCDDVTRELEAADRDLLRRYKHVLRDGVQVFERLGPATLDQGADLLRELVIQLPGVLEAYFRRIAAVADRMGSKDPAAGMDATPP